MCKQRRRSSGRATKELRAMETYKKRKMSLTNFRGARIAAMNLLPVDLDKS